MTADPRTLVEPLAEASGRLVRTVDAFHGADWSAPSGLPGWSRAHVVAHLTLNAEGLAAALRGVVGDEPGPPMYPSQEARDADIDELAGAEHEEIRGRLLAGCTAFADAFAAVPDDSLGASIERVPGGATFTAGDSLVMRMREVEIHHADLATGYDRTRWSHDFVVLVLDSAQTRGWPTPFRADPDDVDGTFAYGVGEGPGGGPTVAGPGADIAWWLTGRGGSEGLRSSDGTLPEVPTW